MKFLQRLRDAYRLDLVFGWTRWRAALRAPLLAMGYELYTYPPWLRKRYEL